MEKFQQFLSMLKAKNLFVAFIIGGIAVIAIIVAVIVLLVFRPSTLQLPSLSGIEEIPAPVAKRVVATDYIVIKFKDGVGDDAIAKIMSDYSLTNKAEVGGIGARLMSIDTSKYTVQEITQKLKMMEADKIEYVELDQGSTPDFVPNDPKYVNEWHLKKISSPAAWDMTQGSESVIIAILDTGVMSTHPDLAAKLVLGWNTYNNNSITGDVYGHGTAVAGSAAAITNNGVDVSAPAISSKIMPMRISDNSGLGYGSTIASALVWAADHGARVANVSYFMDFSATVTAAAKYFMDKGGVVTMSAGNGAKFYPTATDNPYILTIGATDSNDNIASFSNTGGNIDLAAPGVSIITTNRAGSFSSWAGTSFSAPITAGVAALVMAANPSLTGYEVQDILKQSTDDLGTPGYDTTFGWGRLNAEKAVGMANPSLIKTSTTVDTVKPTIKLLAPTPNSTISGPVSVTVSANDNVGVSQVILYVDNVVVSTSVTAPFTNTWNADYAVSGPHKIYVKAIDTSKNSNVTTPSSTINFIASAVQPLAITNFAVTAKTDTTAKIEWTTNVASVGSVGYGENGTIANTVSDSVSELKHSVILTGLKPGTEYSYIVSATSGTQAIKSDISTFKTEPQIYIYLPEPITITTFAVTSKSATAATIEWTTNVPSTGSINYGKTAAMGSIKTDNASSTSHSALLSGLTASTTYYYQITYVGDYQTLKSEVSKFDTAKATAIDTVKPVITVLGGQYPTIAVGGAYIDAGATASDNIDGVITSNIRTVNPVNPRVIGKYVVTYDVSDAAGNAATQKIRTVNVVDRIKPVITIIGNKYPTIALGSSYTDAGATATDNYDGDLTAKIVTAGIVDAATPGVYFISYTATDSSGNTNVTTRQIKVTDTIKPVLTLVGAALITVPLNSVYTDLGATATDNYNVIRPDEITAVSTVNTAVAGTYNVTYSVKDSSGNSAISIKRTVKVVAQ